MIIRYIPLRLAGAYVLIGWEVLALPNPAGAWSALAVWHG